jgi:secreted Zn-dependent insulinase-like peptidase
VPKAQFYVAIKTPVIINAESAAMTDLYLKLVDERLNESSYAAALAGLGYSTGRRADGVGFIVSGFADKLPVLTRAVVEGLLAPIEPSAKTDKLIDRLRKELIRNWRNGTKDTPYKQLLRETGVLLSTTAWQPESLASALEKFDQKRFEKFIEKLYRGASLEMLASGNMLEAEVKQLAGFMVEKFVAKNIADWAERGVVRVPVGQKAQTHLSIDHKDSAILRYYQGRDDGLDETAKVMMMRQLLRSEFFHQLRTEQQLGYVVAAVDRQIDRVPGFGFLVQSPSVTVEKLGAAIDEFLIAYEQKLASMPSDEFERHRQALLTGLKEKPKSLSEQSSRFWGSIDVRDYDFSRRKSLIAAVEALSQEDMRAMYQSVVLDLGYSLQVDSTDGQLLSGDEIRLGRGLYQLPTKNL